MEKRFLHKLFSLAFGLLATLQIFAGESFQYNGLEFETLSESPKTCKVVYCSTSTNGAISIPAVAQGYAVVEIAEDAFNGCNGITSITIPTSIEVIGFHSFYNCTGINTVNYNAINASYTSVDDWIFNGSPIEMINFGNDVKTVPRLFISNAPDITSVVFTDQIDSIGSNAFYNCNGIKTITLGASVKKYTGFSRDYSSGDEGVKNEPPLLEHIYISDDNPYITIIDDVIYAKDMSVIDYYPNYRASDIYNVPTTLQSMGQLTFRANKKLRVININSDVKIPFWDEKHHSLSPFDQCVSLEEINVSGNSKYTSMSGVLYTKDKKALVAYPAARQNTSFTIPSTVEEVYPYAARRNSKLQSIIIPNNVKVLGEYAFGYSEALTSVSIGNGVTVIPRMCFVNSPNLTSVTLPEGLQIISVSAFSTCTSLSSINLPSTLKTIGHRAFNGTPLQQVTLPAGLLTIGEYAFRSTQITTIDIPSSVIYVGELPFDNTPLINNADEVFSNHVALKLNVTESAPVLSLPTNITIIAGGAAKHSYAMTDILLAMSSSIKSIGSNAFSLYSPWYQGLENGLRYIDKTLLVAKNYEGTGATVKAGTKGIAGRAFYNSNITNVNLPEGLTTIGEDAFLGAKLQNLFLPNGLKYIGFDAFAYCEDLEYVTIPATVEVIDDYAFEVEGGKCSMHSFVSYATTPPLLSGAAFYYSGSGDLRDNCILYVPNESLELYRNTEGWKQFKFILPHDAELLEGDVNADGIVDVDDMNAIINIILHVKDENDFPGNSDLNGDGIVDVDDMNYVINIILTQ